MKAALHTADLVYGTGVTLHTASSGSVASLRELYLVLNDDQHQGLGEVRFNISYLNGYAEEEVLAHAAKALEGMDLKAAPEELLDSLPSLLATLPAPVRCLIDCALHDLVSKRAGLPLASWLRRRLGQTEGDASETVAWGTNQTLFWSPFEVFMQQAESYVARGYLDLKVRIAAGDFAEDVRRIQALRDRFGGTVGLAADANAQWSFAEAKDRLAVLRKFDLKYVEQPVASKTPADLIPLVESSGIPLMVDEGLQSKADVAEIASLGGRLWAHLKLVKLGGLGPTLEAARTLQRAGVPFMVGQMNEGGGATAAALHLASAVTPQCAELYGADGLANDPVFGLDYRAGGVSVLQRPGLGVDIDLTKTRLLGAYQ